jgi:hypothetical protein
MKSVTSLMTCSVENLVQIFRSKSGFLVSSDTFKCSVIGEHSPVDDLH